MSSASNKRKDALVVLKFILVYVFIIPLLVLLVGDKNPLRWVDYDTYVNYFEIAKGRDFLGIFQYGQDPFFVTLMKPFTLLTNGFLYFTVFCAFVTLLIKYSVLRRTFDNKIILFILYSSYFLCLHDYIQIRVSLALAFVLYSIYCVKNRNFQILLFIVGALIHLSVVFPIAVYAFTLKFKGRKKIPFFMIMLILPYVIFSGVIHNVRLETYMMMVKYKENYYQANLFASQPIIQSFTVLYIMLNKKLREYCQYRFEYMFSCAGIIAFYSMFKVPVLSFRFYEMTMLFFYIMLSQVFKKSKVIMFVYLLLILLGLKQMFYGESALLVIKK